MNAKAVIDSLTVLQRGRSLTGSSYLLHTVSAEAAQGGSRRSGGQGGESIAKVVPAHSWQVDAIGKCSAGAAVLEPRLSSIRTFQVLSWTSSPRLPAGIKERGSRTCQSSSSPGLELSGTASFRPYSIFAEATRGPAWTQGREEMGSGCPGAQTQGRRDLMAPISQDKSLT